MIEILDNKMSLKLEKRYYKNHDKIYFKLLGREEKQFKDTVIYEVMSNFDEDEGAADYAHYTIENDGSFGCGESKYELGDWNLDDFRVWLLDNKEEIEEAKKEIICIILNCKSN